MRPHVCPAALEQGEIDLDSLTEVVGPLVTGRRLSLEEIEHRCRPSAPRLRWRPSRNLVTAVERALSSVVPMSLAVVSIASAASSAAAALSASPRPSQVSVSSRSDQHFSRAFPFRSASSRWRIQPVGANAKSPSHKAIVVRTVHPSASSPKSPSSLLRASALAFAVRALPHAARCARASARMCQTYAAAARPSRSAIAIAAPRITRPAAADRPDRATIEALMITRASAGDDPASSPMFRPCGR